MYTFTYVSHLGSVYSKKNADGHALKAEAGKAFSFRLYRRVTVKDNKDNIYLDLEADNNGKVIRRVDNPIPE